MGETFSVNASISLMAIANLIAGASLAGPPAGAAEPKPLAKAKSATQGKAASAADIIEFCKATLPKDAEKKALSLGWHPVDALGRERLRSLVNPPGDAVPGRTGPKDVIAWQRHNGAGGEMLVHVSLEDESDGSLTSALKSFAAKPHDCLYLGGGTATSLKAALTQSLGASPGGDKSDKQAHHWETSNVTVTLREIPPVDSTYTVLLSMFYK